MTTSEMHTSQANSQVLTNQPVQACRHIINLVCCTLYPLGTKTHRVPGNLATSSIPPQNTIVHFSEEHFVVPNVVIIILLAGGVNQCKCQGLNTNVVMCLQLCIYSVFRNTYCSKVHYMQLQLSEGLTDTGLWGSPLGGSHCFGCPCQSHWLTGKLGSIQPSLFPPSLIQGHIPISSSSAGEAKKELHPKC